jgi:oligoribonuclease
MPPSKDNLIWLDMEMTGLDCENDSIIEIATVITDNHLNILAEGPAIAIHHSRQVMEAMDEWNTRTHADTGLTERVLRSNVNMREAEERTLEFIKEWVEHRCSPMCGNSVCQDRRFLARQMPELENHFHYRNLDVSTIKELARRWEPGIFNGFFKVNRHSALSDIKESIEELRYYSTTFFTSPNALTDCS